MHRRDFDKATLRKLRAAGITFISIGDGEQIATHSMGDEYAKKIIDGTNPMDSAIRMEDDAHRRMKQMLSRTPPLNIRTASIPKPKKPKLKGNT